MIHYLWYVEGILLILRWNGKKRALRVVVRPERLGQAGWTPVRKYTLIDLVQILVTLLYTNTRGVNPYGKPLEISHQ